MNALVLMRQAYEPYKEWTGALTMCFFVCQVNRGKSESLAYP